jgi:hypothetical protein
MTTLLSMIPIAFAVSAVVLVIYYFSDTSEKEIMKHALAAKKFQIYDSDSQSTTMLRAAKFYIQQRATQMMTQISTRIHRHSRRPRYLFDIVPRVTPMPAFRAEKFKIILGFFQIFGGFKKVYEIPWPNEMSRLMDFFSIADLNVVDTTGIECFFKRNYFASYR